MTSLVNLQGGVFMSISEQQRGCDMIERARIFCKNRLQPIAKELDENSRFPSELLGAMGETGFFGMNYDIEYGGGGYDSVITAPADSG